MHWFTPVAIPDYPFRIIPNKPLLAVGSCFAHTIGQALYDRCFPILVNPAGILFNPASIHQLIHRMAQQQWVTTEELWQHNGLWHHWDFHGSFSKPQAATAVTAMNKSLQAGREALQQAQALLITYGTAHVWELADTGMVVANNHKQPHSLFHHRLLSVAETQQLLADTIALAKSVNPSIQLLLTVSPVRHLRDGAIANNRSKAHLLAAVLQATENSQVHYFPAFELLLDELRDYRFYAADHAHPSKEAEAHIWERYKTALLSDEALRYCGDIEPLLRDVAHRPLHSDSEAWQQFVAAARQRVTHLQNRYPDMPVERLAARWEGL